MKMRKMGRSCILAVFALLLIAVSFTVAAASPATGHDHGASSKVVSADQAVKLLAAGNDRFTQGKTAAAALGPERRLELAGGQHPFAVVVTCSDSRVPPELIFNQGLGDIFVIRVAGNVLSAIELGSVEYAVEHLNTKLVVVLGHEKCGAVKATVDGGELPVNIKAIAEKIEPAVMAAKAVKAKDVYEAATEFNIYNMTAAVKNDPVLASIVGLQVVGAKYQLGSGKVVFLP